MELKQRIAARTLASSAIGAYQRYVSPRKGFACACRVHEGRASCAALGRRAIAMVGLRRGVPVLRKRLRRCGEVHRRVAVSSAVKPGARRARDQRGDCDCGGCDLPGGSGGGGCDLPGGSGSGRGRGGSGARLSPCDVCDCCDSPCDGGREERNALADWGPTLVWVLTVLVAAALFWIKLGCPGVVCDPAGVSMGPWWGAFGLTFVLGLVVFVLRLRRDMSLISTLAAAPVLVVLAAAAASTASTWTRWLGA